ncbi:M23 family metallopeptidase [Coxiella-like endosymbiont]|uniref:M23 family metallopeptidase n=1 Tax=Coxiella-like endosymbiont TaxID=1592897 RepID=UPI00272CF720|nr:M23 family metallopeptidase [Coxiella-like endosymbiont]
MGWHLDRSIRRRARLYISFRRGVAFAKWLPDYGFLLIINHGHDYMTLYGRNHFLYKKSGAVVQKGD